VSSTSQGRPRPPLRAARVRSRRGWARDQPNFGTTTCWGVDPHYTTRGGSVQLYFPPPLALHPPQPRSPVPRADHYQAPHPARSPRSRARGKGERGKRWDRRQRGAGGATASA
jgi:hypothetical protein